MRIAILIVILSCLAGCRRGQDAPADIHALPPIPVHAVDPDALRRELVTEADFARLADRSLGAYERAATALERAGIDCDAAALALREIVLADGEAVARAKSLSELPDLVERARPVLEQRMARTSALAQRLSAALVPCGTSPPVAEVMIHF